MSLMGEDLDSASGAFVPSPHEKQAVLAAVLQSGTFARSEQLRAFLRYICQLELEGRAAEIGEYQIGTKALGRPADFSPLEDSSVRTRAHELRRRLQKYYDDENPLASLRIALPKGSYVPRYVAAGPEPEASAGPAEPEPEPEASALGAQPAKIGRLPRLARGWLGGFLAGSLLVSGLALALNYWRVRSSIEPAIRQGWEPIVTADKEILIALATPLHLQVTPYLPFAPTGTPQYPAPPETYELFRRFRDMPEDALLQMMPAQKAVNVGNVEGLVKVIGTLDKFGSGYRILSETNAPLKALRNHSAMLFGSPWYSRSAATLLEQAPWTIQVDKANLAGLVGRGPQAGKNFLPGFGPRHEYREVFGLLSVLPNDEDARGGHSIVVFAGITSAGVHAAAAFFTSGSNMRELSQRFRKEGLRGWPRSYQVVVRCRSSEDTMLLSYKYETHQVIAR